MFQTERVSMSTTNPEKSNEHEEIVIVEAEKKEEKDWLMFDQSMPLIGLNAFIYAIYNNQI